MFADPMEKKIIIPPPLASDRPAGADADATRAGNTWRKQREVVNTGGAAGWTSCCLCKLYDLPRAKGFGQIGSGRVNKLSAAGRYGHCLSNRTWSQLNR